MRYFKKIVGPRLYLSPVNTEDAQLYTQWLNDVSVSSNIGPYAKVISLASEEKVLERMACEGQNYAMVLLDGDRLIGNISLMDIDGISRRATVGLFIGDAENRGKGYGAEALRLLLGYGFQTLNLHNIMLQVHEDNAQAIACYEKVGFREFGRRRESLFKNGAYIDVIHMDILAAEFHA